MADHHPVFETDKDFEVHWSDPSRSNFVGSLDTAEAKREYGYHHADLFVRQGGSWLAYRVKDEFGADRDAVRAFTKRVHQESIFRRSVA